MKAIYISDELHRRAKQWAAEIGLPLKEVIERWVAQGMREIPAGTQLSLRETAPVYEIATPVEATPAVPPVSSTETENLLAELERRGLLVNGERLREQFQAEYLALRNLLGITSPPAPRPAGIDEVRAIFQHQRELHPDAPTVGEIIRQMREEE